VLWNPYRKESTTLDRGNSSSVIYGIAQASESNDELSADGGAGSSALEKVLPSAFAGSMILQVPRIYLFQIWGHEKQAPKFMRVLDEAGLTPDMLNVHLITIEDAERIRFERRDGFWQVDGGTAAKIEKRDKAVREADVAD